jgi:hypothetical protein
VLFRPHTAFIFRAEIKAMPGHNFQHIARGGGIAPSPRTVKIEPAFGKIPAHFHKRRAKPLLQGGRAYDGSAARERPSQDGAQRDAHRPEGAVDAGDAMLYHANGLFSSIGNTFKTPDGANVTRREAPYLPIAAVQKTTDNFLSVSTDATARRIALKEEIARTTTALKSATTDAEVQKLTGVLIGLSSALNNTDYEINQATSSALVQDVANRNEVQRQIEAKKEQQHAEFTEAVQKYGQTFRLMNAPTAFPTP